MSNSTERSLILNHIQVNQKVRRIAFEIYENNFKEKKIVLAGIEGQGYKLATLLAEILEEISSLQPEVIRVKLDKDAPQLSSVEVEPKLKNWKRCLILVDDVLNSGRTLAYGMQPFLHPDIKKIEVAVLVNRSHTKFPIQSTYTGYALATTLSDHVEVKLGKRPTVYLT